MNEETVHVSWYEHDCDYISKYCEDMHRVGARVPIAVLRQYGPKEVRWRD